MTAERSGSTFACGDLRIDVGRQRVIQAGRDIELPKLSFDVLLAMARAAPNVLSTNALMDRVWAGIVVNPETVIQRISLLREALGDDSREPRYIGSLRSRGYFLIPSVTDLAVTDESVTTGADPASMPSEAPPPSQPVPAHTALAAEPRNPWRKPLLIGAACAGLAALAWIFVVSRHSPVKPVVQAETAAPAIDADTVARTIAVMPFSNQSPDPDDAFLATSLPEMILN